MTPTTNIEQGIPRYVNFSDAAAKEALVSQLRRLTGVYRVSVVKRQRRRSLEQNAFLWGPVYSTIAKGIYDAWGESLSVDEVHILCKSKFLGKPIVNRTTGEEVGRTFPSSAKLDVKQFSEYLENINRFAGEFLGCVIPPAATFEKD